MPKLEDKRPPERVTITDTNGDGVSFAATVKDQPSLLVDVTEHAVEQGANVVDHARRKLITLSLEGIVSDLNDGQGTAQAALAFFIGLHDNPRVVEIVTPRSIFGSMIMTSCDLPRRKEDGRAARFALSFKEYRVVSLRRQVVKVHLSAPDQKGPQQGKVVIPPPNTGGTLKNLKDQGNGSIVQGAVNAVKRMFGGG